MRKLINAYILFASIFFFHLIWIFQGLDGYDLGFHLNHQVAAVSLEFSNSIPSLYFLTDLVGGIWLKIINVPNLLWVRLGGILLFCLNGVISFKILTVYFDRKKVFFVIFAVTLFITGGAIRFTIEHYTFPALLVNIALLIFNQLLNQTLASRSFKIYAFLLGFMTIPIILARLPLLLIVFIPVLVLAYYVVAKKDMMELRKSAPYVIFGVATSLLVFAVFYQTIGFLDTYIVSVKTQLTASAASDVSQFSGAHYGILTLIKKYIRELNRPQH